MNIFKTKFFYIGSLLFISSFLMPSYGSEKNYLYGFECTLWAFAFLMSGNFTFFNAYVGVMSLTNILFIFYPIVFKIFRNYISYYLILMSISTLWLIGFIIIQKILLLHKFLNLSIGYYCWVLSFLIMSSGPRISDTNLIKKGSIDKLCTIVLIASVLLFIFTTGHFVMNLKEINNKDKYINLLSQEINPPKEKENIYVSHLSFIDPSNGSSLFHNEVGKLINGAVTNGIHSAQKVYPQIQYNAEDHKLEDTDTRVYKLVEITFDNILTRNEKISKIIKEIMEPANIDVIVTGLYIDKGSVVDIRPLIIVKYEQKIVTKLATFEKKDFLCSDPYNPSSTFLCKKSCDKISELVEELLAAL